MRGVNEHTLSINGFDSFDGLGNAMTLLGTPLDCALANCATRSLAAEVPAPADMAAFPRLAGKDASLDEQPQARKMQKLFAFRKAGKRLPAQTAESAARLHSSSNNVN